ncbi:MAG: Maf family protein [Acidimicrobiia bacterium]|jgi:septum formation protein
MGRMTQLILASSSPRRHLLLRAAGFEFEVESPGVDETVIEGEDPDRMVVRLAREKALACAADTGALALGADTTVVLDGRILGKPEGEVEAVEMLLSIGGRTHVVITGWALAQGARIVEDGFETTLVAMRAVDPAEAKAYAASGEPLDKAGAYALQGDGARFVSSIGGSRSNVVGLPLKPVVGALRRAGIEPVV